MTNADLELQLEALSGVLEYPPTPDIAPDVARRLRLDEAAGRPARHRLRRTLVGAGLGTLVVAAAAVAAVPGVRDAVLDLIDLRGATVETTTAPAPSRPATDPDYGEATSLEAARGQLRFNPLLPARRGAPDATFIRAEVPGGELTLLYGDLAIGEFRGDLVPEYFAKLVPTGTDVDRLRVEGEPAAWFSDAPHFFAYRGPGGEILEPTVRAAGNVLLVERGRLLIRIEGASSRAQAIELARSLTADPG